MAKEKKDQFEDLDADFKAAIESMSPVEIKVKVAEIALEHSRLMKAKKEDGDLKEKQEAYKEASAVYREGVKFSKLRIDYCKAILDNKGVE